MNLFPQGHAIAFVLNMRVSPLYTNYNFLNHTWLYVHPLLLDSYFCPT